MHGKTKLILGSVAAIILVIVLVIGSASRDSVETSEVPEAEVTVGEAGGAPESEAGAEVVTNTDEPCRSFTDGVATINGAQFDVEIAHTRSQQAVGLQGCPQLDGNQGMYFVYQELSQPAFWMKGMLISLDIIWVRDGTIVGITPNVPPAESLDPDEIPQYLPPEDIDGVLEIAAGRAAELGVTVGDTVSLTPR